MESTISTWGYNSCLMVGRIQGGMAAYVSGDGSIRHRIRTQTRQAAAIDVRLRVVPVTLKMNRAAHCDRRDERANSAGFTMANTLWCSPVISRAGVPAAIS